MLKVVPHLKIWPKGPDRTESMVPGSCKRHAHISTTIPYQQDLDDLSKAALTRSINTERGTYLPPEASLK